MFEDRNKISQIYLFLSLDAPRGLTSETTVWASSVFVESEDTNKQRLNEYAGSPPAGLAEKKARDGRDGGLSESLRAGEVVGTRFFRGVTSNAPFVYDTKALNKTLAI